MTDREISIMATEYAKLCDPLNQTIEKQADIRWGFIAGFKQALRIHDVGRSEQLAAFAEWLEDNYSIKIHDRILQDYTRYGV